MSRRGLERPATRRARGRRAAGAWAFAVASVAAGAGAATPVASPAPVTVRAELLVPLQAVRQALIDQHFDEALRQLAATDGMAAKTADEVFLIEQMRSLAAGGAGDPPAQLRAIEVALATGKAAAAQRLALTADAARVAFALKDHEGTVRWTRRYLEAGGNDGIAHLRLVQALHLLGRHEDAAQALAPLAAMERDGRWKVIEPQLRLQLSIQSRLGDEAGRLETLTALVASFPQPSYWAELLLRTAGQPGFDDGLRLDMLRLGATAGAWTEAGPWVELAERALYDGFPTEAHRALEAAQAAGLLGDGQRELMARAARLAAAERRPDQPLEARATAGRSGQALFNAGLDLFGAGRRDEGLALMTLGLERGIGAGAPKARLRLAACLVQSGQLERARPMLEALEREQGPRGLPSLARFWQLLAPPPRGDPGPQAGPGGRTS